MRRTKLYSLVALALSVSHASAFAQSSGLADTRPVKPLMMLLVDTSGSMERMPNVAETLPVCSGISATDATQKNRWFTALEALTGSFKTFACVKKDRSIFYPTEYDADYFLPHYDLTPLTALPENQRQDGVLDSYATRLKFGLMTFDGVSTTLNGATLVPQTTYNSDSAFKANILGRAGMYSYPDAYASPASSAALDTPRDAWGWKPLSFPGCTSVYGVNAGARGKGTDPGSLISVGPSSDESSTAIAVINEKIQSDLLKVRPFGGTPIAGMLDDLRYYLNNDNDVKKGGDAFYGCRKRFAILLTDGAPDTSFRNDARFQCESSNDAACSGGICQCPYDTEENIASTLRSRDGLEKLWVVAFNVSDTVAISKLNAIAQAGSSLDAYPASNVATLRTALDKLMSEAQPNATSRSVPVMVNTGNALQLGGKQFQVTAGFKVGESESDPWEGRLYRQRILCEDSAPKEQDLTSTEGGDQFHITLNARSTARTIQTLAPSTANVNGSLIAAAASTNIAGAKTNINNHDGSGSLAIYVEPDLSGNTAQGNVQNSLTSTLRSFDQTLSASYFNNNTTTRNAVSDYVRGVSAARSSKKLGDIYHSNPTVTLPVYPGSDQITSYSPQLRAFYKDLLTESGSGTNQGQYKNAYGAGRPGVVYVGSNDGILHAFNLDAWKDKSGTAFVTGHEFWGFVPPALFDKLPAATQTHQFMFDGTPVVRDMVVSRNASSTDVRTILVSAVRGTPAFIALDVTFPEQSPKFLWQRAFTYLGDTVGQPALTNVRVTWNGTEQTRGVAILPGGKGDPSLANLACNVNLFGRGKVASGRDKVRCWPRRGRSLYVVDVLTGELIQEFDGRHFQSPMTGGVAVDGDGVTRSSAAYMTDEDGVLWRLSMLSTNPSEWRVMPIWDLYAGKATDFSNAQVDAPNLEFAGRTATYPPLLTRNPTTGDLDIVVGTGDVDALTDAAPNRIVSLKEVRTKTGAELGVGTVTANWNLQLDKGEAVTGPPVILNDAVYFTSFTGPAGGAGDICALGTSRLVGAHVREKEKDKNLPKQMLPPENGVGALVLQYKPSVASDSLLLGLSISRDPICIAGQTVDNDPLSLTSGRVKPNAQASGGNSTYQLRAMVAGGSGGSVMGGTNVTDKGQRQLQMKLPIPNVARSIGWASSVE